VPTRIVVLCSIVLLCGCASDAGSAPEPASAPTSTAEPRPAPEDSAESSGAPSPLAAEAESEPRSEAGSEPALTDEPQTIPPLGDAEREIGRTFQPLADEFGFTEYVHAARTPSGGILFEYLPEGDSLDSWNFLGTLLLTRVAKTWEEGAEILPRYASAFAKQMQDLNEAIIWPFPEGQVSFIDYEIGTGASREHNLATIWQVLPGTIALFQAQRRTERFSQWQIDHFKTVAQRLGRADRRAAGAE
jgi:hypothetical protein